MKTPNNPRKELQFYRVFFRYSLPFMCILMATGMYYRMEIPLEYVIKCWIVLITGVIMAYILTKWILKSREQNLQ